MNGEGSSVLGALALAIAAISWVRYLALIPREKVPKKPSLHLAMMAIAAVCSVSSIALGAAADHDRSIAAMIVSATALGLALFFVYLLRQAPLPDGELRVRVGDRLRPFRAQDSDGMEVTADNFRGRRILFKFFRGHW